MSNWLSTNTTTPIWTNRDLETSRTTWRSAIPNWCSRFLCCPRKSPRKAGPKWRANTVTSSISRTVMRGVRVNMDQIVGNRPSINWLVWVAFTVCVTTVPPTLRGSSPPNRALVTVPMTIHVWDGGFV